MIIDIITANSPTTISKYCRLVEVCDDVLRRGRTTTCSCSPPTSRVGLGDKQSSKYFFRPVLIGGDYPSLINDNALLTDQIPMNDVAAGKIAAAMLIYSVADFCSESVHLFNWISQLLYCSKGNQLLEYL